MIGRHVIMVFYNGLEIRMEICMIGLPCQTIDQMRPKPCMDLFIVCLEIMGHPNKMSGILIF